jgi:hypothetical protein
MATAAASRPLIASVVALAAALIGSQSANAQNPAPCGACATLVIDGPQANRLPPELAGLEVLVRIPARDPAAITEVLETLAARGAKAGIVVEHAAAIDIPETAPLHIVVLRAPAAASDPAALAFELKTQLTTLRASLARQVRLGVWASRAVLQELLARDIAAYVDFAVSDTAPSSGVVWWRDAGELSTVVEALRPSGVAGERSVWTVTERGAEMMTDLASAARMLPQGLIPSASNAVSCGDRKADVWLDPATLAHVALVENCTAQQIRIRPAQQSSAEVVPLTSGHVLVRIAEASSERFAEGVNVSAARTLTIQEIVARHQAAAARQAAAVQTRIATGHLSLTFEAPGFPAPLTITSPVTMYVERGLTEMEQQDIRVNGLAFAGGRIPRLPLIEPERVASAPLAIELTDVYRYALSGVEMLAGRQCYVVRFEPNVRGRALFRGTAWIAADDFGLVKVAATQVGLRGPIVSSDQIDEFALVDGMWLLRESRVNQIYEGAAHRTPIERVLTIVRTEVNPQDFASRRAAAYASPHVMLRDTPQGYRYLRRDDPQAGGAAVVVPTLERAAERVRTLAVGVIVDPNISRPLPFAGLSYVDFDLFGTGTQFNGFFGGTFGQLAFSIPSIAGSRWQVAGRAFAIASWFNDRAFDQGIERYEHNIRQRPAQASVWALHPITPRVTFRAGYDLDYTDYAAADTTSPEFTVPVTQVIHAARIAIEGQRQGWTAAIWWAPAIRQRWRPWGTDAGDQYDPAHRDFQRYGASLARSAVLTPAVVARAEAVWLGGHDLDRFSRYSFGAFDNRLRGYPGALIRFDRGAVVRGVVAWSAASHLRIDAFADSAFVHDPGFGSGLRSFTGLGTAVEAPAPFGTLVAAEWGFGIQGRRTDGQRGTHVFRVSAYKVF